MNIREMSVEDISKVINLYIESNNNIEKSSWNEEKA